jgi:hypothetical protein
MAFSDECTWLAEAGGASPRPYNARGVGIIDYTIAGFSRSLDHRSQSSLQPRNLPTVERSNSGLTGLRMQLTTPSSLALSSGRLWAVTMTVGIAERA